MKRNIGFSIQLFFLFLILARNARYDRVDGHILPSRAFWIRFETEGSILFDQHHPQSDIIQSHTHIGWTRRWILLLFPIFCFVWPHTFHRSCLLAIEAIYNTYSYRCAIPMVVNNVGSFGHFERFGLLITACAKVWYCGLCFTDVFTFQPWTVAMNQ